jgi:predicted O-methyltransferase YrrM
MDPAARLISVEIDRAVQAVASMHLGGDQRVTFETTDAHTWLCNYHGEPFDFVFVDCRPGRFHALNRLVSLLRVGGLYVADDLLPQPTWPDDHQQRVDGFLDRLPRLSNLRAVTMAWSSGLVVGARV